MTRVTVPLVERQRRIHDLWNWLPAFRAVAETEHLPTASQRLRVSPSALSRAVKLLEEEVGTPLFHRVGRNLQLNDAGEAVLAAVRDAMRRVDEGVSIATGQRLAGAVRAAVCEAATPFLDQALVHLATEHPELELAIVDADVDHLGEQLTIGLFDLAVTDHPRPLEELERVLLAELPCALYGRADHPLAGQSVTLADLEDESFAAPDRRDPSAPFDPWPQVAPRRVHLRYVRVSAGVSFVRAVPGLIALPCALAEARYPELERVDVDGLSPVRLIAWRRGTFVEADKAEIVLDAMQRAVGSTS
jgi:DNA-binding transcriptional LysR family regulator